MVFAPDARAKEGAIGRGSETTELHRGQLPTAGSDLKPLPSFANNGWPEVKASCATAHFYTRLQIWKPGAAPERWSAFGQALKLPPSEGAGASDTIRAPGISADRQQDPDAGKLLWPSQRL